tara:strand:+ start:9360 stop:9488 length:129 start_codon:yes stop_codon:yes gene_type:complete
MKVSILFMLIKVIFDPKKLKTKYSMLLIKLRIRRLLDYFFLI